MDHGTEAGTLERGDIMRWRKAERLRLIADRLKLATEEGLRRAAAIARHLTDAIGTVGGRTVAVYWPFRGEPSLRSWMDGGGFYGRTLAAMARKPLVIGVGSAMPTVATIHPLPHDIPMHFIVTEGGCTPTMDRAHP